MDKGITAQWPLRLVLSIDVEEEGLFSREYQCVQRPVSNVASLMQLAPMLRDAALPLTLFCAHAVFSDVAACRTLAQMRDSYGAEVAAHLHHWNTPPVQPEHAAKEVLCGADAVSTALVPVDTMARKLETLFAAGRCFQGADLTSFRMGRWDLRREHWPLLAQVGVKVDASVRPLHAGLGLKRCPTSPPDHFMAPLEPYPVQVGSHQLWEVPLTTSPLMGGLAKLLNSVYTPHSNGMLAVVAGAVRASVQKWGALTLLPVYQPLWLLKLCTLAHVWAGGRTISMTWHSSEMMPQGASHMPTQDAVNLFLRKMRAYVDWLRSTWPVEGLTMEALGARLHAESYADATAASGSRTCGDIGYNAHVDWTYSIFK